MTNRALIFICIMALCTGVLSFSETASAGLKATIPYVDLVSDPPAARPGAVLTITANMAFGGGCCYDLYVRNTTAELTLPSGLALLSGKLVQPVTSSDQVTPGNVTARKAGLLTKISLTWTIRGNANGEYPVSLRVSGYSLGPPDQPISKTGTLTVVISSGIVISKPVVYPETPIAGYDVYVLADITSVSGAVRKAMLNYSFDNRTWTTIMMSRTSEDGYGFAGSIPARSSGTDLYFYIFASDSLDYTTSTAINRTKISYYEKHDVGGATGLQRNSALNYALILGTIACAAATILSIAAGRRKKPVKNIDERTEDSGTKASREGETVEDVPEGKASE